MKQTLTTKRFLEVLLILQEKGKDVTQMRLAEILGTTQANISLIKNGHRNVPSQKVPAFCHTYGVNPNYIFMGKLPKIGKAVRTEPSYDDLFSEVQKLYSRIDAIERHIRLNKHKK